MLSETQVTARIPAIDGLPWHITTSPELGEMSGDRAHEVVDHAFWQTHDGKWHCWACVRKTKIGRLFYGWESDALEETFWKPIGITMRAEQKFGESINDWIGEEFLQAPHVIYHDEKYWMFYGGHNTELAECQICLATSQDGYNFQRHQDDQGFSRLFIGPGEARDPMVIRIGDQWVCYYTGHDKGMRRPCKIYARTSTDLIHWSDYREVAYGGFASGTSYWSAECPFVIFKDGYYYLFRTSEYASPARTHVYRSLDPFDFGLGNDSKLVTTLRIAAPEIIQKDGVEYISTVEDLKGGIQLSKLRWI